MHGKETENGIGTPAWLMAAVALGVVWLGVALAWGGAWVRWAETAGEWTGCEWSGVALSVAWAVGSSAGLTWVARHRGEKVFVAAAVGLSLAGGLVWAVTTRGMAIWPMDSGYFRGFLDGLAKGGYTSANLQALSSNNYDYAAWATRSLPFLHPLRLWAGAERFGLVVQMVQAVLLAASVGLSWRMARLLFGVRAARWTAVGLVSMPAWSWQAVGLNHQVWAIFAFAAGMWLLAEWMFGEGGMSKRAGMSLGAILLASIWMMEGAAGMLFRLFATLLLVMEMATREGRRLRALGALVFLVFLPQAAENLANRPWAEIRRSANPASMNGGTLAFMARGWDLTWGGEYSETVQNLDILTPPPEKNRFFRRFLAAQCAWNGPALATKLFPVKLAKFMLAGYASLAEEVLWANGAEETARVARGMRVGWFLLFHGPLMLWGLHRLARRLDDGRCAWCLLPVAGFAVAVMLAGETSPRYSMPVQSLLLAAGMAGLAARSGESKSPKARRMPFATSLALATGVYLVFAGALLGLRGVFAKKAFADMRTATLVGGRQMDDSLQAPFEAVFPDGQGVVTWPGHGGDAVVYLRGNSWKDHARVRVDWSSGNGREITLPVRLEPTWPDNAPRSLAFRRMDGNAPVFVGYAFLE